MRSALSLPISARSERSTGRITWACSLTSSSRERLATSGMGKSPIKGSIRSKQDHSPVDESFSFAPRAGDRQISATRARSSHSMGPRSTATPVIVAGALILSAAMGIRQTFGLFVDPIALDRGLSLSTIAVAIALHNLVWGFAQPFAGAAADRYGAAPVVGFGAVAFAAGLTLAANASTGFLLVIGMGLLVGIGVSCTTFAVVLTSVGRVATAERRSMAMGLASAGGSFGQFALVPATQLLSEASGLSVALLALAVLMVAVSPLGLVLDRRRDVPPGLPRALQHAGRPGGNGAGADWPVQHGRHLGLRLAGWQGTAAVRAGLALSCPRTGHRRVLLPAQNGRVGPGLRGGHGLDLARHRAAHQQPGREDIRHRASRHIVRHLLPQSSDRVVPRRRRRRRGLRPDGLVHAAVDRDGLGGACGGPAAFPHQRCQRRARVGAG